jgi:hypothetical protein
LKKTAIVTTVLIILCMCLGGCLVAPQPQVFFVKETASTPAPPPESIAPAAPAPQPEPAPVVPSCPTYNLKVEVAVKPFNVDVCRGEGVTITGGVTYLQVDPPVYLYLDGLLIKIISTGSYGAGDYWGSPYGFSYLYNGYLSEGMHVVRAVVSDNCYEAWAEDTFYVHCWRPSWCGCTNCPCSYQYTPTPCPCPPTCHCPPGEKPPPPPESDDSCPTCHHGQQPPSPPNQSGGGGLNPTPGGGNGNSGGPGDRPD